MKVLMLGVLFCFCISPLVAQTTEDKLKEFDNEKFALVQKLLTCQTLAKQLAKNKYPSSKGMLSFLGDAYYNEAYQSFVNLQALDPDMDGELRKHVGAVLLFYSKSFKYSNSMESPEMILALSFVGYKLRIIVDGLY